jgi:PTS system nitrogen regulatory IIA component
MDLKIKDVCALLGIPEKTLVSWIKEGKIPAYDVRHQYFFNSAEIQEWVLKNKWPVSKNILDMALTNIPVSLNKLLKKGGIAYGIKGHDAVQAITNSISVINLPAGLDRQTLTSTLLEREEMMPTAMGKGIAIPHPRNPIVSDIENENVSLCFLEEGADFQALDGEKVTSMFIVLCANARRHLEILSRIAYLCQQEDFMALIKKQACEKDLLEYIETKEKEWMKK